MKTVSYVVTIVILLAQMGGGAYSQGADWKKLDAVLRAHYHLDTGEVLTETATVPGLARRSAGLPPKYREGPSTTPPAPALRLPQRPSQGTTIADVWISLTDPQFDRDLLRGHGVQIRTDTGSILTAFCPVQKLVPVSQLEGVRYVELARRCHERLDLSVPAIEVPAVWQTIQGLGWARGEGVVVGAIDTGFYWRHEDFRKPDLSTRFISIWDQEDTGGPAPIGFTYGTEWTAAYINAGVPRHRDEYGHGTHVMGIAAGDGSATGNGQPANRFVGVAPEAELIGVAWALHTNDDIPIHDTDIADAVSYILNRAAPKPVAINMSFGLHWGPHDGTFVLDQVVDEFLGPDKTGRAIVCAAGNEGSDLFHAAGTIGPPEFGLYNYLSLQQNPYLPYPWIDCEFWHATGRSVGLRVWVPLGDEPGYTTTDWVFTGQRGDFTIDEGLCSGLEVFIDARESPYPQNPSLNRTWVEIIDPWYYMDLSEAVFFIELQGTGTAFESWVSSESGIYLPRDDQNPDPRQLPGDSEKTIVTPASAKKAICVGAYNTKNQFVDIDGIVEMAPDTPIGEIAFFSSRGPLRDGTEKPDVAAPGNIVISTYSADEGLEGDPGTRIYIERDGVHVCGAGTSMAAPHVTGVAALLLQKNPDLDSEALKAALRSTAVDEADPGWDKFWGAGRVNAQAAFDSIGMSPPVTRGDVNDDGSINAADAILVSRHILALERLIGREVVAADADESGVVDEADADWILETAVGIR